MLDTLFITTMTCWEEPPRIRQQIALEMSKYCRSVLFIETPCLRKPFEKKYPPKLRQVASNIFAYRMPRYLALPKNAHMLLPLLSDLSQAYVAHTINSLIKKTHADNPVLINFNPSSYSLHALDKLTYSVFVLNDDFAGMAQNSLVKYNILRSQALCASRADLCLTVSLPLYNQLKDHSAYVKIILPGHTIAMDKCDYSPHLWSSKTGEKVRVCFMGYINNRLLYDWISHAAGHPLIEFSLVGPLEISHSILSQLKSSGVQLLGEKTEAELHDFLRSCHVLTMPYNPKDPSVIPITASNKLFQYIAAKRPIVASEMPNLINLPAFALKKARDKQDFLEQILLSAQNDCIEHQKQRTEIASQNTWEQRGLKLIQWIKSGIREKSFSAKATGSNASTKGLTIKSDKRTFL